MSHRRAGLKGIQQKQQQKLQFQQAGQQLQKDQLEHMQKVLDTFKENLENFAKNHAKEIRKNAAFRSRFQEMCSMVGVDPLASTKGFWTELLGFGDFYYEISVQIIQVCISTREKNGGLIEFGELKKHLEAIRGNSLPPLGDDDILQSLKCLKPLGDGYRVVQIGKKKMIQSVPDELNPDHASVLSLAENSGCISVPAIIKDLSWEAERAQECLNTLVKEGICWIDQGIDPPDYYIAGMFL